MTIEIDCHGATHVGQRRTNNEDQFLIADLSKSMRVHQTSLGLNHQARLFGESQGKLLLVADGLGGHESGERASMLAVDGVANYVLNAMDCFFKLRDGKDANEAKEAEEEKETEFIEELRLAFRHSQTMLESEAVKIPQRRGMATTLTMAYVIWPILYVVHVGDTRCYVIGENNIDQITTDHTVSELTKSNRATEADDRPSSEMDTAVPDPMGHALWNVIGGGTHSLEPEISKVTLKAGDQLLLCSDGLTGYLGNEELAQEVRQNQPVEKLCERLIDLANQRGGQDNITIVLARFRREQANVSSRQGSEEIVNFSPPIEEDGQDFLLATPT